MQTHLIFDDGFRCSLWRSSRPLETPGMYACTWWTRLLWKRLMRWIVTELVRVWCNFWSSLSLYFPFIQSPCPPPLHFTPRWQSVMSSVTSTFSISGSASLWGRNRICPTLRKERCIDSLMIWHAVMSKGTEQISLSLEIKHKNSCCNCSTFKKLFPDWCVSVCAGLKSPLLAIVIG